MARPAYTSRTTDLELGNYGVVSEWVSSGKKLSPVYGDRIEMNRWLGVYQHWALYIGNDIVVNFTDVENPSGKKKADKVKIIQSDMYKTIATSSARINNSDDAKYFKPANRDEVNKRIQKFMDTRPGYNVKTNNCEHFVNYCRYEVAFSKQADPTTFYNPNSGGGTIKLEYAVV
ncbi:phospholipase A and acyltransferase 2-like [Amphiura filiformis]|uniref:phospholipase A and acyltransferase 2-like n=1 Tax=Amphiura filiformis TaxID=82378 RepID=UPI003B20C5B8